MKCQYRIFVTKCITRVGTCMNKRWRRFDVLAHTSCRCWHMHGVRGKWIDLTLESTSKSTHKTKSITPGRKKFQKGAFRSRTAGIKYCRVDYTRCASLTVHMHLEEMAHALLVIYSITTHSLSVSRQFCKKTSPASRQAFWFCQMFGTCIMFIWHMHDANILHGRCIGTYIL